MFDGEHKGRSAIETDVQWVAVIPKRVSPSRLGPFYSKVRHDLRAVRKLLQNADP
jgi:hypothetical protein